MHETAAVQLQRVLTLSPHLADGDEHSVDEIAAVVGTTRDELMSDLLSLSERFDVPGAFVEGVAIYVEENTVSVTASHFHRPMRLTMSELSALELGLSLLRRSRTPAEHAPIDRALERLRLTVSRLDAADPHEGIRYAELSDAGSAAHLSVLRSAIRDHKKVRIGYRSGGATESTMRDVSPHSLLFAEQMWYVASANDDGESRFYRLDRIESVEKLSEKVEPDATATSRARESGRVFDSDSNRRMTVYYSPRVARWVAEREGKQLASDGSLTLEHVVADDSWAIRHVLQYGADAEILEPESLREMILAKLDAM
jgi:proteasome accessory factor C